MRRFVALAKIGFSEAGVISTLGTSFGHYEGDAAGLVRNTWYPILQPEISLEVSAVLPWQAGEPTDAFGTLVLINGKDGLDEHLLDRFVTAQVSGLNTEIRRGYDDQTWDEMELWFLSKNDKLWFEGDELMISQRSRLDVLDKPLITRVFADPLKAETGPGELSLAAEKNLPINPRIINDTVPLLLGPAFQILPKVFNAPNQVLFVASNLSGISVVREGGRRTTGFSEVDFGIQITQGAVEGNPRPFTVDAIGPAPDTQSETVVVDWLFDAWTGDNPDGIDVTESASGTPLEAEISQSGTDPVADITVLATPTADTGWLALQNPFEPVFFGLSTNGEFWTFSGAASVEAAVIADDGSFAQASFFDTVSLRVSGFMPALPDGNEVTGVEIELVVEGTNVELQTLTANQTIGGTRVAAYVDENGEVQNSGITAASITSTKSTLTAGGVNFVGGGNGVREDVSSDDVNGGMHFTLKLKPAVAGVATVKLHQVRLKVHHRPSIDIVRLFSPTAALEEGERHTITIEASAADIYARWGGSATSGGALKDSTDPFSTSLSALQNPGRFSFEFVPEKGETFFGVEFKRLNLGGTAAINRITVKKRSDGLNRFASLVPYMASLVTDQDVIDQAFIDAHDEATGSPEMGTYIRENESFAEVMSFFVRSLSGIWWRDRDAKARSKLVQLPAGATPDFSLDGTVIDGVLRQPKIASGGQVKTSEAPNATERAVGAKNQDPLRIGETAGISEEFSLQELANVIEEWRVRRRANFDALNPWPVPPPPIELLSIAPTSGTASGGDSVTLTGKKFDAAESPMVWFGSQPATSVVVVDDETITCVTPAEAEMTIASISPTEGSDDGGTAVTITGTGFAEGAVVKFGSKEALNVVIVDAQTITCETPPE